MTRAPVLSVLPPVRRTEVARLSVLEADGRVIDIPLDARAALRLAADLLARLDRDAPWVSG